MNPSSEINPDVEKLPTLKAHAIALDAFINSPAHAGYKEACSAELANVDTAILSFEPMSINDVFELFKLYGQRRELSVKAHQFEVAYDGLKTRIAEAERAIQKS